MQNILKKLKDAAQLTLAGLVLALGSGCKATKTSEIYDDNIRYITFSQIDFKNLSRRKINPPDDMINIFSLHHKEIKNRNQFDELIFEEAEKLGYDKGKIKALNPKEAVQLSLDILAKKMTYFEVDKDESFIKEHGKYLPIDEYFSLGKGDCDKYASIFAEIFNLVKSLNPKLKNVYVSNNPLGRKIIIHDWNILAFLEKREAIVTHIDPTQYDNNGKLEAEIGYHFPTNDLEFKARFFSDLWDWDKAYELYFKRLGEISDDNDNRGKANILREMAYIASQTSDKSKIGYVWQVYNGFEDKDAPAVKKLLENMLYYSYIIEKETGNANLSDMYRYRLTTNFPDSYWTEKLKERE